MSADTPDQPTPEQTTTSEAPEATEAVASTTERPEVAEAKATELAPSAKPESPSLASKKPQRVMFELERLIELAVKYPEIGPPLAELAMRIGERQAGDRILKMGLDKGAKGVEYFLVAAGTARRDGDAKKARGLTIDALKAMAGDLAATTPDDHERLLHLVRIGFSTLLFDEKNPHADGEFIAGLREFLPALEPAMGQLPFFHVLTAQTRWYDDKQAAEASWAKATELGDDEHTWNAHGTWLKDAERDYVKAEQAYKRGLDKAPQSALLHHNLAQVLLERAGAPGVSTDEARKLCNRADEQLRLALKFDGPKGLRRHVHSTRDRLNELRGTLPAPERKEREPRPEAPPPAPEKEINVGDTVTGKIQSLTDYGAFVQIGRRVGLLHKSELAWEFIQDISTVLQPGQDIEVKVLEIGPGERGRQRIALSRKALLERPAQQQQPQQHRGGGHGGGPRRDDRGPRGGGGGGGGRGPRHDDRRDDRRGPPPQQAQQPQVKQERFLVEGKVSMADLLMAKLKEQAGKE